MPLPSPLASPTTARLPAAPTLYQAVLGADFDLLAPALRRFHGARTGGRARGTLRVDRGRGPLAWFAGACVGAPRAGAAVDVDMQVEVLDDGREVWRRSFAGKPMRTRQWRRGPLLAEALGPSTLYFELQRDGSAMCFAQRSCTLLGIPVPRALSPRVVARAAGHGDASWRIEVDIALPLIGTIIGYSGIMSIED